MKPLAVYIHWPYCLKKCPYCDFNSHVTQSVDHDRWRAMYEREIAAYAAMSGRRSVASVFFGGGTPSLMQPQTVETVLAAIARHWPVAPDCEITLEANPTSIEAEKFRAFRAAGINRVSIGVQSLRNDALRFLGREHSAAEALKALEIANAVFDRTSFDLIYARPGQTATQWREELAEALPYAKGHLSLYQLTIEPGTQFKTLRDSGRLAELDGDLAADLYEMTQDMTASAGLPAYEISNHAAAGQESRHNLTYWRYGDYIGIGPGAHGRLTLENGSKIATRAHKAPELWMRRVAENGHGAGPFDHLSKITQAEERLMMGLRLREGVDITNHNINRDALKPLTDSGMLTFTQDRLSVPAGYWPVLDSVLAYVLTAVSRSDNDHTDATASRAVAERG